MTFYYCNKQGFRLNETNNINQRSPQTCVLSHGPLARVMAGSRANCQMLSKAHGSCKHIRFTMLPLITRLEDYHAHIGGSMNE